MFLLSREDTQYHTCHQIGFRLISIFHEDRSRPPYDKGSEAACLTTLLQDRAKHPPDFGLGLLDARLERGEIRRVTGPRHDMQEILAGGFRIEPVADAKPQDLRQVVVEQGRRSQDFR